MVRPPSMDPTAILMKNWWNQDDIQKAFWENNPCDYRNLIINSYTNYLNWLKGLENGSIPLIQLSHGILPGDVAADLQIGDQSLGVVGLNSAWLQLDDRDYKGKLAVHPRQLMELTNNDPDGWCAKHDFNLLVTHHPQDWLHSDIFEIWRSEVHTPSRFDAHLFGHVHKTSTVSTSEGGTNSRRYFQGESLFGLEKCLGSFERNHGYSILQLHKLDNGQHQISQWPRRAHKGQSSVWKIIENPDLDCNDSGVIKYTYDLRKSLLLKHNIVRSNMATLNPASGVSSINILRKRLAAGIAFSNVRGEEKELGIKALTEKRSLWLVSDWGLGHEQFIRAIQTSQQIEQSFVYELDCQNFHSKMDIYFGIQALRGVVLRRCASNCLSKIRAFLFLKMSPF